MKKQQQVWVVSDGKPVAVPITTGATDGIMTALVQGNVEPGTPLIVEMTAE